MQTFLPYPSFIATAKCLDYRRLGKQRVETIQILNTLLYSTPGWRNHPIINMWRGFEVLLIYYGLTITEEWINRGYKDTCHSILLNILEDQPSYKKYNIIVPNWLGDYDFHASHRSNLLRKDYEYYSKYNWIEPIDLPYIWYNKDFFTLNKEHYYENV